MYWLHTCTFCGINWCTSYHEATSTLESDPKYARALDSNGGLMSLLERGCAGVDSTWLRLRDSSTGAVYAAPPSDGTCSMAFDGLVGTGWWIHGDDAPHVGHWIDLVFSSPARVDSVRYANSLVGPTSAAYVTKVQLEFSRIVGHVASISTPFASTNCENFYSIPPSRLHDGLTSSNDWRTQVECADDLWSDGSADSAYDCSAAKWVQYDFGATCQLTNVNMIKYSLDSRSYRCQRVDVSTDAQTWTTVWTTDGGDGPAETSSGIDVPFSPARQARYLRTHRTACPTAPSLCPVHTPARTACTRALGRMVLWRQHSELWHPLH